jgi:hypothetical protein
MYDQLLDPSYFASPIAHWITGGYIVVSALVWVLSEHGSGQRKLAAVGLGSAMAVALITLLASLFPATPLPPGVAY